LRKAFFSILILWEEEEKGENCHVLILIDQILFYSYFDRLISFDMELTRWTKAELIIFP